MLAASPRWVGETAAQHHLGPCQLEDRLTTADGPLEQAASALPARLLGAGTMPGRRLSIASDHLAVL